MPGRQPCGNAVGLGCRTYTQTRQTGARSPTMSCIDIRCHLHYLVSSPSDFMFNIAVSSTRAQKIESEKISINQDKDADLVCIGEEDNRVLRLHVATPCCRTRKWSHTTWTTTRMPTSTTTPMTRSPPRDRNLPRRRCGDPASHWNSQSLQSEIRKACYRMTVCNNHPSTDLILHHP